MHLPDFELHYATTLEDAAAKLVCYAPHSRLLAGGTDLLVDLKTGRTSFNHLVSLNRLHNLRGVTEVGGLHIGALTTVSELGRSPAVRARFAPILDAASRMAAPQIRNVATVGGNIASAVPCADLPPILTALNASAVLWSPGGERKVQLESLFVGPRQTIALQDEILTAVHVPRIPSGFGAAYARFGLRDGNTIAVAAVAASLHLHPDGTVKGVRIVLGAVAPIPKLVSAAGADLFGELPGQQAFERAAEVAMIAAEPISDVRGSADFRRELVRVLTRQALSTAYQRIKEAR